MERNLGGRSGGRGGGEDGPEVGQRRARTTQGVRWWPTSVRSSVPLRQQVSFTVWSPLSGGARVSVRETWRRRLAAGAGTHWVVASRQPSGEKAAAMVERAAAGRAA